MMTFNPGDVVWWQPPIGARLLCDVVHDSGRAGVLVRVVYDGRERTVPRDVLRVSHHPAPDPGRLAAEPDYGRPVQAAEQPREPRHEDPQHLAWIRGLPCAWCDAPAPSDPHHYPTRGAGGGDHETVPLCRGCHERWHSHATLGHMTARQTVAWIRWEQVRLLSKRLREVSDV